MVSAPLSQQGLRLDEGSRALLDKEWVTRGSRGEEAFEGRQREVSAEQRVEQLGGARRRQRVETYLRVVGLAPPAVLELEPVVDEQEHTRCGQALDQAVEQRPGFGIDPVKILEDYEERPSLRLAQEQPPHPIERPLPALRRVERLPPRIVDRNIEEREKGWQRRLEGSVQSKE